MDSYKDIERYLLGEMTSKESLDFEQKISKDQALAAEVEDMKKTIIDIRHEGRKSLKAHLQALDKKAPEPKASGMGKRIWLLALVAALSALIYFMSGSQENDAENKTPSELEQVGDTANEEEEDSELNTIEAPSGELPKENIKAATEPKERKARHQKTNNNKEQPVNSVQESNPASNYMAMYEGSFQIYRHPSLQPGTRGNDQASNRQLFEQAYWDKQYDEVLKLWTKLSPAQKENGNLIFLKAMANMAKQMVSSAQFDLLKLKEIDRYRFKAETDWYLILTYLRQGDVQKVKSMAAKIPSEHKYKSKIKELIKQLE